MDRINVIPPWISTPQIEVDYFLNFPPFQWSINRGEGWVTLVFDLFFAGGVHKPYQLSIERVINPVMYKSVLNLNGYDLVEFEIRDATTPFYQKYLSYPRKKGDFVP